MDINLITGSSPHIRNGVNTPRIMLDVIIALTPAAVAAIYFFKWQAFLLLLVTIVTCMISEYVWTKLVKKENTLKDLSAIVTGILLAFNLSPCVPLWVAAIGGVFAIIIAKQLFGGLGHNFINPALAARAFLMASWPVWMTSWKATGIDAASSATPLALIKKGAEVSGQLPSLTNLFIGNVGGCIGETSALALLIGAVYLLARKVITLEIPMAFIGTVAIVTWIFGGTRWFSGNFSYHILAGGLMLGAFFMATDYTTSPVTSMGKLIMGCGCGLLTSVIRLYGGYPEGVSYAILLMNLTVPLIDKLILPKSFGGTIKNA
ncbi:MAG: RnfABCDGE type electron transport complex subunit D [Firmicutes bacterium]|nr:RnfABCDGE type electron transport complex subunit D [Bacillota bacterium]